MSNGVQVLGYHPSSSEVGRLPKGHKPAKTKMQPPQLQVVPFKPRTDGQRILHTALRNALTENRLVFAAGPAGTGKTLLAISQAVDDLLNDKVERILLTRPAVSADEELGFLPGDIEEKLGPYLRPLYDALKEKLGGGPAAKRKLDQWMNDEVVEIAPLGFMRGRTFKKAAVIVDEAQNCTYIQLKMALTRLGIGSYMVMTGDPHQVDLPDGQSGLAEVLDRFEADGTYPVIRLKNNDIQREKVVADVVRIL